MNTNKKILRNELHNIFKTYFPDAMNLKPRGWFVMQIRAVSLFFPQTKKPYIRFTVNYKLKPCIRVTQTYLMRHIPI